MSVRRGGQNGHLPLWKLDHEPKFYGTHEVNSLIQINWFNSCNDSLFAGMTLTLRKSHFLVSCIGDPCRPLMSARLPAEVGDQIYERIVLRLVFIA